MPNKKQPNLAVFVLLYFSKLRTFFEEITIFLLKNIVLTLFLYYQTEFC